MNSKKTILLLLCATFISLSAEAQRNIVKANPIGFVFGIANLSYELSLADDQSITLSGSYFKIPEDGKHLDIVATGANVAYGYYFLDDAPKGLYGQGGVGVFSISDEFTKVSSPTLMAKLGYQWILWDHFAVDLYGQYNFFIKDFPGLDRHNISPGLSLGYAW